MSEDDTDSGLLDRSTSRKLRGSILIGLGAFACAMTAWWSFLYLRLLLGQTAEADAVVAGCSVMSGRNNHGTALTLQFTLPGGGLGQAHTRLDTYSCDVARSHHFRVVYLQSSPDVALTNDDYEDAPARYLLLWMVFLVLMGIGVAMVAWSPRARALPDDTVRDMPSSTP